MNKQECCQARAFGFLDPKAIEKQTKVVKACGFFARTRS